MKPIETAYAGYRFRSRLEARWAVFFDAMSIQWEYEPQGFEVEYRLSLREGTFPYLPDFWLPTENLFVEVKGSLNAAATVRLLDAAACLSIDGHDLLVLGKLPDPTTFPSRMFRLHFHKGDLFAIIWPGEEEEYAIAQDTGTVFTLEYSQAEVASLLIQGGIGIINPNAGRRNQKYIQALTTARSARFEHGETPWSS